MGPPSKPPRSKANSVKGPPSRPPSGMPRVHGPPSESLGYPVPSRGPPSESESCPLSRIPESYRPLGGGGGGGGIMKSKVPTPIILYTHLLHQSLRSRIRNHPRHLTSRTTLTKFQHPNLPQRRKSRVPAQQPFDPPLAKLQRPEVLQPQSGAETPTSLTRGFIRSIGLAK